jgi:hypothetical protein
MISYTATDRDAIGADLALAEHAGSLRIFESARCTIAAAETVEEVKRVLALATGLAAAARQATDRDMESEAAILKLEAERRLGQLMAAQREAIGLNTGTAGQGRPKLGGFPENLPKTDDRPTLAEAGIGKNLAHRARTAASMAEPEFKAAVRARREAVRTPSCERKAKLASNGADHDDIGASGAGELARLTMRIGELENDKRRLRIAAVGLNSEIDDLRREVSRLRGENLALRSEVRELRALQSAPANIPVCVTGEISVEQARALARQRGRAC